MISTSQIASNAIFYIFTIFVIGLIVLFGYQKVVELKQKSDDISIMQFKKHLDALFSTSMSSGNEIVEDLVLPAGFSKLCFINLSVDTPSTSTDLPLMIYNSWKVPIQKNIFLLRGSKIESFYFDKNKLGISSKETTNCKGDDSSSFLCCDALNGKLKLKFIGKGNLILVQEPII